MNYQIFHPSAALAGQIKCYWTLEGTALPGDRQRIFPDGCIELVFHYGDLFKKYHPGNNSFLQPRSFIHGQLTRFIEIGGNGHVGILSIRFKPDGLSAFINIDSHELNDDTISVAEIWGAAGRELEERMLHAAGNDHRILIIEHFLLQRLKEKPARQLTNNTVAMINRKNGMIIIDDLAGQLNTGRRQLERQFIASVGLSPKQYARIIRFQYILSLAEQKRYSTLTDLAYCGGFYDQAHFIKDFKSFTGLSPKQYFSEHLPLVKFFSSE